MAMDGIALRAVVFECRALIGGKIDKVQQPEKDLLLFTVRIDGKTLKLLICTHAENGRIQLTGLNYDNPAQPPALCMLLRRRLTGARITDIRQIGADRVCEISLLARNELFDETTLRLVAELTGKHANLVLLEADGTISDCVRRVSAADTNTRILLPGFPYEPVPVQEKLDPFSAPLARLEAVYASADPVRALTQAFAGVSKQSAAALASACPSPASLQALLSQMRNGLYAPCVAFLPNGEPATALPFAPGGMFFKTESCESMSAAFDRYFAGRDTLVRIRRHGGELRKTVSNALSRAQNKYAAFEEAISGTERYEEARAYGELILANLRLVRPGAGELIALDYRADPPQKRAVPLDPALGAQENAKKYFKIYRKGKLGKAYAEEQIGGLSAEIAYLEGQLENIEKCETLFELGEIKDELVRERYIRPAKNSKRAPKPNSRASEPMRFVSSDGIAVYVGKNNRQNDALTLQQAKPDNVWLHAKNIPGSHVIVDFEGEPPERTLREAASLAAYYSKARLSGGVPVDYTPRKFVKKPSGARPGMMIYSTNRTLYVTPDPALAQKLRSSD